MRRCNELNRRLFRKPGKLVVYNGVFNAQGSGAVTSNQGEFKGNIMGDRSPKSVQKQATQKQAKASKDQQKKQQALAAKQPPKR